jgi:uncharacterized protein YdgA (DUF945 family)
MKKTLALIIIAVISAGIVAPKIVGYQFSTTLDDIAKNINNAPGYTVEIKKINSQWLSTEALLVISLDTNSLVNLPDETVIEDYSLEVEINAQHGPFLFNEQSNLAWLSWTVNVDGEALREHLDWSENKDFYQINGLMNLAGNFSYHDKIESFSAKIESDKSEVVFKGYQGSGQYNGQELSYQGAAAELTATSDEGDLLMNNLTIDINITASLEQILNNGLYDSESKINFSSIVFKDNESKNINITDFYVLASSSLNKVQHKGNVLVSYGIKAADINEYPIEDLALDLAVNNISGGFVQAYQEFSQTLGETDPEHIQDKMLAFFQDNLLTLLSAEPQINITSLRGTFPEGKINGTMHSSLSDFSTLPTPIEDQQFWLAHALVNSQIIGDKAVIEFFAKEFMKMQLKANPQTQDMTAEEIDEIAIQQVPQMLDMLTQQGLLVATETQYTTDIILKDGQLKVNEKLIPLPL